MVPWTRLTSLSTESNSHCSHFLALSFSFQCNTLHDTWNELKTIVENRVDAATNYIKFLQSAEKLTDMFSQVEAILRSTPEESKVSILDDAWARIKPAYGQLKEEGNSFLDFVSTVSRRKWASYEMWTIGGGVTVPILRVHAILVY